MTQKFICFIFKQFLTWTISTRSTFGFECVRVCVSNMSSRQCPTALLHRVNTNNGDKNKTEVSCTFSPAGNSQCLSVSLLQLWSYKGVFDWWVTWPIECTSAPFWPIRLLAHLPKQRLRLFHHNSSYVNDRENVRLPLIRFESKVNRQGTFGLLCNCGNSCCSLCLMVSAITLASRLLMCSALCSCCQRVYFYSVIYTNIKLCCRCVCVSSPFLYQGRDKIWR